MPVVNPYLEKSVSNEEMDDFSLRDHPFIEALSREHWLPLTDGAHLVFAGYGKQRVSIYGWPISKTVESVDAIGKTWVRLDG